MSRHGLTWRKKGCDEPARCAVFRPWRDSSERVQHKGQKVHHSIATSPPFHRTTCKTTSSLFRSGLQGPLRSTATAAFLARTTSRPPLSSLVALFLDRPPPPASRSPHASSRRANQRRASLPHRAFYLPRPQRNYNIVEPNQLEAFGACACAVFGWRPLLPPANVDTPAMSGLRPTLALQGVAKAL